MSKIYLIQSNLNSLAIIEVELIKKTTEQLRVDLNTARLLWKDGAGVSVAYLSSRLQRHRQTYTTDLPSAISKALELATKKLESARSNVDYFENQIAQLQAFAQEQEENNVH